MVNMLQRKLGFDVDIANSLLMSRKGTKNSCEPQAAGYKPKSHKKSPDATVRALNKKLRTKN
jgi:hypothetical protein